MSSPPRFILLPGLDGTELFLTPVVSLLSESASCRVVRYPGSGSGAYGDLLVHVSKEIEKTGPCVLFGYSFGGPLALMAAALHPQLVKGVILCASFLRLPWALRSLAIVSPLLRGPVVAVLRAAKRASDTMTPTAKA